MSADLTAIDPDRLIAEVLVEEVALQERIAALGEELSRDYAGREPLLVGVL
jgi:hypoxanthine-guanine phosphoribosyltransferase